MEPPSPLQTASDVPGREPSRTSLSPETASTDASRISHAQQPTEESLVEESVEGHASTDAGNAPDASDSPTQGDVGQLSLFG